MTGDQIQYLGWVAIFGFGVFTGWRASAANSWINRVSEPKPLSWADDDESWPA